MKVVVCSVFFPPFLLSTTSVSCVCELKLQIQRTNVHMELKLKLKEQSWMPWRRQPHNPERTFFYPVAVVVAGVGLRIHSWSRVVMEWEKWFRVLFSMHFNNFVIVGAFHSIISLIILHLRFRWLLFSCMNNEDELRAYIHTRLSEHSQWRAAAAAKKSVYPTTTW